MALKTKIIVQQILNIDDTTTTASKYPKYTVVLGTSISSITASELTGAVEASAASAAAAKDSEIAAKESETNAKDSENLAAIYANSSETSATQSAASATEAERQAGLSKDSADASATSAEESKGFRDSAELAAQNAEQSRLLAEQAKKDAEAAKTAAATSEQNAATSATESTNQAIAAAGSATEAGEYATTAKDSEIAAKTSELNAKNSENESAISAEASEASASQSAISASQSAASATKAAESSAAAKISETTAIESSAAAKTSEINAKTSEINAKTSETNAAAYAAAAKTSETNAADSAASASDSKGFRDEAEAFAAQASTSALAAKNSETNTKTSEINSKASEDAAKLAQQSASGSANTATQAMTTTKGYRDEAEVFKNTATTAATTATDKALEAAGSATIAGEKATNATSAADRAETAAASAEQVMQASLKKDQNLNDLANKDLAREALKVEAVNSVKDQYAGAYNSFRNPAWTYELRIANNGEWRVARNDNNSTSALSIGAGGTGAENVEGAKINFGIDRLKQTETETMMYAPGSNSPYRITIRPDAAWGVWTDETGRWIPLSIDAGGTGSNTEVGARKNLNTPVGGQAIIIPNNSNILGFMSTYAESGYYSSGELVTYQPPEASGWWMYELHVHGKNANGHVEYGNIVATAMNGNKWGIICSAGSWGGWYRIARSDRQLMLLSPDAQSALGDYSIAIGDHDSGLKWDRDGHISAFADSARIFAWTPSGINTYRVISSYVDDNARGMYVNGVRRGYPNALIAGQVEGGSFADWRSRASGLLVEHTGFDSAVAIFKSVYWGKDWIAGMDVVPWTSGGAETHLYVKGAEFIFDSAGNGSASNWVSRSDIRLKAHLKEIETASDKIDYLTGYTYYKRNNLIEDENSVYSIEAGLIAQDVERVLPEAVHSLNNDGQLDPKGEAIKGINYNGVVALLVNAFKEQKAKIDNQQEEINVLRNELYELKNLVKSMLNGNAPTITELP
ncbi:tail fiber protein [Salmonella phage 1-19]|uniref:Putative tail protein n=3 Tax=Epseptimavirus TaxID=2732017 RepID=A0A5C2IG03_9CAUD|nr:tail fiber protein [Salmonella phage 1-29]YP_009853092.1 tail fiber protein [Salmonella phage 1-19]QEP52571.1 putative tail protein [Salmonella phage 9-29]QEP52763.1 putative tail protein [Salmonella phage 1-29]QFR58023.1 putative tail protein [Salmonella phage 1-19]